MRNGAAVHTATLPGFRFFLFYYFLFLFTCVDTQPFIVPSIPQRFARARGIITRLLSRVQSDSYYATIRFRKLRNIPRANLPKDRKVETLLRHAIAYRGVNVIPLID